MPKPIWSATMPPAGSMPSRFVIHASACFWYLNRGTLRSFGVSSSSLSSFGLCKILLTRDCTGWEVYCGCGSMRRGASLLEMLGTACALLDWLQWERQRLTVGSVTQQISCKSRHHRWRQDWRDGINARQLSRGCRVRWITKRSCGHKWLGPWIVPSLAKKKVILGLTYVLNLVLR